MEQLGESSLELPNIKIKLKIRWQIGLVYAILFLLFGLLLLKITDDFYQPLLELGENYPNRATMLESYTNSKLRIIIMTIIGMILIMAVSVFRKNTQIRFSIDNNHGLIIYESISSNIVIKKEFFYISDIDRFDVQLKYGGQYRENWECVALTFLNKPPRRFTKPGDRSNAKTIAYNLNQFLINQGGFNIQWNKPYSFATMHLNMKHVILYAVLIIPISIAIPLLI
jgi:hypothetical protein